jgi:argininosuccinate lyase
MRSRSNKSKSRSVNDEFLEFTSSVATDKKLWKHDIAGSIAHAHTLASAQILSQKDLELTVATLKSIAERMRVGKVVLDPSLEDIHMNVEKLLIDETGDVGRKLHTGRSRNDQVALDTRLWTRDALVEVAVLCAKLQAALVKKAKESPGATMPGYTHLQHAQPVLLSHHLLAHFWKIQRDLDRVRDCYARTNVSPLGAGALAGTTHKLDRSIAPKLLGMNGISQNSLDAVSDRDFTAEATFALALLMTHLSSISEELILWSSNEFGFVKLPHEMSSGSSIMPQKRNPDLPELVRGASGRAIGDLVAILTLLKSLPLAYNRDLQESKVSLFDAFDIAESSLRALTAFLKAMRFDKARMRNSAEAGLMTATDLADFLTIKGVPFRTAHGIVKDIAERADGDQKEFMRLSDKIIRDHVKNFNTSELSILSVAKSIGRRSIAGGTGPTAVAKQMEEAHAAQKTNSKAIQKMKEEVASIDKLLM